MKQYQVYIQKSDGRIETCALAASDLDDAATRVNQFYTDCGIWDAGDKIVSVIKVGGDDGKTQ